MNRRRVVITGVGAVTPLAHNIVDTWKGILAGVSGADRITLFDTAAFAVKVACEVKDWDATRYLSRKRVKELDRFSEFAVVAAQMAIADAGIELTEAEQRRAGCIIGVNIPGLNQIETASRLLRERDPTRLSPYMIPSVCPNLAAGQVSIQHRLKGPTYSTASACATGAHAIGEAGEWIRRGRADVMVAGGTEACITDIGIAGFQAMRALSKRDGAPGAASRPFDRDRDGFVCGEGSGVIVLESAERARARGATIYAELTGYGASSDAHHIVMPREDGEGAIRAMEMALEDAELSPDSIDYINAHATSTPAGDLAEIRAICSTFGERAARGHLAVSSTKSMTGHLLGAAGAVELIFSALAIRDRMAPPTINVDHQDAACPLDVVPNQARALPIRHAMSNAFGFGGTNATLIASAYA